MAGLKEVRNRIASVKSTQQITNAMKMVAASKLRRAQTGILKLRPYAAKLQEILQNLSASIGDSGENAYTQERKAENVLLIVIASNRGLCGGFNSYVLKLAANRIHTEYEEQFRQKKLKILTIGRKSSEYFRKRGYKVLESRDDLLEGIAFDKVSELAEKLMKSFVAKEFDRIEIIYNQFKNAAVQRQMVETFLPIEPVKLTGKETKSKKEADYLFEPDKETIVRELIPKSLRVQLFKAVLDSYAAEQGARMTAMHKATENAKDLLKNLRLTYNKVRQATITNEILEIVSGAEALKG
jgi:F-type H+-transporting ATPase subunit gamma